MYSLHSSQHLTNRWEGKENRMTCHQQHTDWTCYMLQQYSIDSSSDAVWQNQSVLWPIALPPMMPIPALPNWKKTLLTETTSKLLARRAITACRLILCGCQNVLVSHTKSASFPKCDCVMEEQREMSQKLKMSQDWSPFCAALNAIQSAAH